MRSINPKVRKFAKGMKSSLLVLAVLMALSFAAKAETYCNPARSAPCGNGCIPLNKQCTKSWTTSKVGVRKHSNGKRYSPSEVKFVEKAPSND